MTGEKNRYTTTEKLWKLDDDTLKTPKHDEMVLWLLKYDNVTSIFPELFQFEMGLNVTTQIRPRSGIMNTRLFNENFWDLLHTNKMCEVDEVGKSVQQHYNKGSLWMENNTREIKIKSEIPISAKNGFLVGYCDVVIEAYDPIHAGHYFTFYRGDKLTDDETRAYEDGIKDRRTIKTKYIEVKPTIKSFGETLRQLNTYKHYLHTEELYLFTTDLRFKDAFESQGIKVLTYPDQ